MSSPGEAPEAPAPPPLDEQPAPEAPAPPFLDEQPVAEGPPPSLDEQPLAEEPAPPPINERPIPEAISEDSEPEAPIESEEPARLEDEAPADLVALLFHDDFEPGDLGTVGDGPAPGDPDERVDLAPVVAQAVVKLELVIEVKVGPIQMRVVGGSDAGRR